jgi:predicted ester cyclase
MFAAGDKVVARITIKGTHQGEFMGMPPTGRSISFRGIDIIRFSNGKLVEHWGLTDTIAMMQQLGAMDGEMESPVR